MKTSSSVLRAAGGSALAFAASVFASSFALAAPPAERVPADVIVPSDGIPSTTPWGAFTPWPSRCLDDIAVIAGPTSSDGRVLYAWTRDDVTGQWNWSGLLPIAGTAPTGTEMTAAWLVFSNRTDTIATTHLKEGITVIRKINGEWTYRGMIPVPYANSSRRMEVSGDTALTWTSTVLKFWRFDEGSTTWLQTGQQPIDLIGVGSSIARFRVAAGIIDGVAIVPWLLPQEEWATGRSSIHTFSLANPAVPIEGQEIFQDEENPWALGPGLALGPDWLAVRSVQRTDPANVGRIGFYKRNAEGQFERTQFAAKATSAYPEGFSGDRFIGGPAIWTLDASGQWNRGAELTPDPQWFSGNGCIAVTADYKLAVWSDPNDCDNDGEVDAFAIASGKVPDCNRNGRPDACDIASGLLADTNGNGAPDACEADCDENGISDLTQIRDGALASCDDPNVLASCAIAGGAADVNGDGVMDVCGPDADGDGVPDVTEIAKGKREDCGGDWIPDDAPTYFPTGQAIGSPYWYYGGTPAGTTMMVAMGYDADPDLRYINRVTLGVGIGNPSDPWSPIGREYKVHIFSDPNGDRLADDGALLWTGTEIFNGTELQSIDVPGVPIGGLAFIVAFQAPQGAWNTTGYWMNTLEEGSGFFKGNGIYQISSLVNFPGLNGGSAYLALGTTLPDDPMQAMTMGGPSGLDPHLTVYTNGCPIEGDVNGDGVVNGADLGHLLGDWGEGPSLADLNGDGVVDGVDLGTLLGAWTG